MGIDKTKEVACGKKLLRIAIPLAWVFSGITSFIALLSVAGTLIIIPFDVSMLTQIVFFAALPVFHIKTCVQIYRANRILNNSGHNYEQILSPELGFLSFSTKYPYKTAAERNNPYIALRTIRGNIMLLSFIQIFLLILLLFVSFIDYYNSWNSYNSGFLLAAIILSLLNPGFFGACRAYKLLYGNEINRKKQEAAAHIGKIREREKSGCLMKKSGCLTKKRAAFFLITAELSFL